MTRVLVVEDEESFSDALSFMLRKEGFEVGIASTGTDAVAQFDQNGADVVLLDLMLPGMSGTEVCRTLRQRSRVPIIMVTAKDGEVDKVVGLELGADDYVTKPFSSRELVLRIRGLLKRGERPVDPKEGALRLGPIEIHAADHRAIVGGKLLTLTLTEFRLLEDLVRAKGRVRTRETLLAEVWGYDSEVLSRTVDTHVRRLRSKLGDAADWLVTVRGVGYRIQDPADER